MTQIPIEHIEELAAQTAARHGAFVTELVIRGELRSKVLEVYVDTDEGITIDTCSDISRELSAILDEEDLILGAYRLDVSSPDLNRPIHVPRQYRKNTGRVISIAYTVDGAAVKTEGVLEHADDEHIVVRPEHAEALTIQIGSIQQAYVVPQLKKRK